MRRLIALLAMFGLAFFMFAIPTFADEEVECGTPAKDAVYETVQVKVKDAVPAQPAVPAVTETIPAKAAVWANWAPNDTKGPQNYTPVWPTDKRGTWIVHDQLPPGHAGPDGVYQQGQGNSPWFYRQAAVPERVVIITPAKDAVPAQDAVYETRKVLVSPAVPAGPDCEEPETPRENPKPPVDRPEKPVVNKPVPPVTEKPEGPREAVGAPVAVPTAVAAGLAAADTEDEGIDVGDLILGLIIGAVLAGGTLLFTRRSRGDHHA